MEVNENQPKKDSIDKIAMDEIKNAIQDEFKKNKMSNQKISFNDTDSVLDMGTNTTNEVLAPKTIDRLEEISRMNKEKEREEYDGDDDFDDEDGPLNIMDESIDLGGIEDLTESNKINDDDIILDDIEVLA